MRIFMSAPFYNEREINMLDSAKKFLEGLGHETWCAKDNIPKFNSAKGQKDRERVLESEKEAILKSNLVLGLLEYPSSGVAMEMQFAIDHNIPAISFILSDHPNLIHSIWLDQTNRVRNFDELKIALEKVK